MLDTAQRPLVSCENLTKIYKVGGQEIRALDGVDLTFDEGDFIAIIGASGSGKSTLMNMLGGLDKPSAGEVHINGKALSRLPSRKLSRFRNETIGFVFQQFQLLPKKSALENVRLPLRYRSPREPNELARAQEALEKVGLGDRMKNRPTELSGGQQQRVAIARALVGNPRLLLADEPTGALDSKTSDSVMALLLDLNAQGNTIVVITHDPEVAEFARRVITFRDGRIVSDAINPDFQTRGQS